MPPDLVWQGTVENATGDCPALDESAQGARWAEALKRRHPGQRPGSLDIKACAAAFGVSLKTAEGWAAGNAPLRRHMVRGWALFGWGFLAEILGAALPDQGEQLVEMRRDLARLDRRLQKLGGGHGS